MAAAAVPQRRKGITYGKSHRRVFRGPDFATNFPPQSMSKGSSQAPEQEAAPGIPHYPSDRIDIRPSETSPKFTGAVDISSRASSESSRFFPSDDETILDTLTTSTHRGRKKRKVTPNRSIATSPLHFDNDVSHMVISEEVDEGLGHLQRMQLDGPGSLSSREVKSVGNHGQPNLTKLSVKSWTERTPEPADHGPRHGRKTRTSPHSSQAEVKPPPLSTPKQSPRSQGILRTPDTLPKAARPVTPSQTAIISEGPWTTPRQTALWNRLLTPEKVEQSPSQLKVAALEIDDDEEISMSGHLQLSPSHRVVNMKDLRNSKRLIDSLYESRAVARHPFSLQAFEGPETPKSSADLLESQKNLEGLKTAKSGQTFFGDSHEEKTPRVTIQSSQMKDYNSMYHTRGSVVTYAEQRTYLADNSLVDQLSLHHADAEPESCIEDLTRGHTGLSHPSQNTEYDFEDEQDIQSGTMRSIRELREAGGNARLVGELEVCLDDLDGGQGSTASMLSTLIKLTTKLHDTTRARLFVDKGLETRLKKHLDAKNSNSLIKGLLAAAFLQLLSHSKAPSLLSLLDSTEGKAFFIELLTHGGDLKRAARSRPFNISKSVVHDFDAICTSLLSNSYWKPIPPKYLSCQVLGLQCLRHLTEWRQGAPGLFSKDHVHDLLNATSLHKSSSNHDGSNEDFSIRQSMYILGATVAAIEDRAQEFFDMDDLSHITDLLSSFESSHLEYAEIQISVLHLYLNLMQTIPAVTERITQLEAINIMIRYVISYFVSTERDQSDGTRPALNRSILALLCLMNVAERHSTLCQTSIMRDQDGKIVLDTLIAVFLDNRHRVSEVRSLTPLIVKIITDWIGLLRRRSSAQRAFWISLSLHLLPLLER